MTYTYHTILLVDGLVAVGMDVVGNLLVFANGLIRVGADVRLELQTDLSYV
jgi:hypothetical protein